MKKVNLSLLVLTIGIMSLGELQARTISWCKRANGTVFNTDTEVQSCSDWANVTELSAAQIECMNAAYPSGAHNLLAGEFALAANSSGQKCSELTNDTSSVASNDDTRTQGDNRIRCHSDGQISRTAPENCVSPMVPVSEEQYTALEAGGCVNERTGAVERISQSSTNYEGCSSALGSLGISIPGVVAGTEVQPNSGTEIVKATPLSEISCSLTKLPAPNARARAADKKLLKEWQASAFESAGQILGQPSSASSRRQSQGRRSSGGDNFDSDNFDDGFASGFDGDNGGSNSATRDFIEAPLLTYCESQGTSEWNKFTQGLQRGPASDLWNASWDRQYKNIIGEVGSKDYLIKEVGYSDEEIGFVQDCSATQVKAILEYNRENDAIKNLAQKLKKSIKRGLEKLALHRRNLEKCEALAQLTKESDYDREYETGNRTSKTTKVSFDGQIKCETYGPEAQDFKACSSFINTYDASMVAKTALNSGQQIHYQGESMERQAELARQGSTGGIDHRGALGSQKDDIKDRAGYATQNAALDSAKLAGLFSILQSMPKKKDLVETCRSDLKRANVTSRMNTGHSGAVAKLLAGFGLAEGDVAQGILPDGEQPSYGTNDYDYLKGNLGQGIILTERTSPEICESTANNSSADTLIMNTAMRSKAKQILAQTAIEAAASFAAAGMLNKQAKQIDDLLARIEGYDPSEDFVAPTADLMAGPCAFDPTQEGCSGEFSGTDRSVGFGNTTLSFSGGGFGSSGTQLGADDGYDNAAGAGNGGADRSDASTTVGSIIPSIDKKSGFQDPAAAAARAKSGAAPRSGGGGGGGASAVGSTGSGGGGGNRGQASGGQATGGKQLAYAGSSIGRLSGGRGVGRKPAAKDGGANPFANMFKKGAPGNETLNFRNPAGIGNKAGNIFDQISSRYQVVQTKNRLLEYEEKKQLLVTNPL